MLVQLLGPVLVQLDGREVDLGPAQRRTLLAALAVQPRTPVPMPVLVDRIWGDEPPAGVHSSIYGHVSRLRQVLPRHVLRRRAGGYTLDVDPLDVDLHRFTQLAEPPEGATSERLREALAMWRGPALAGLSSPWVEQTRVLLHERRLAAVLRWAATATQEDPDAVIAETRALLPVHPYAEPLAAALIRALAAAGRPAEALDCFAEVRRRLAADLGVDPGTELRELHQGVLRSRVAARPPSPRPARSPNQLPLDVDVLVGRDADLTALDQVPAAAPRRGGRPSIALLTGPPGVGKTALALRWAHRARERYPDGRLYVDLRGHDAEAPLGVAQAIAGLLRALGVPGGEIPGALAELAAAFRAVTDGLKLLVVLDNAGDSHDLGPLLPASGTCAVVVTSREALPAVVARHGAQRIELEPLPGTAGADLLRRLAGNRLPDARAAADLAAACEGLPLALRLVAELLVARADLAPGDLAAGLRDRARVLDLLDSGGDGRTALRAVFSWSYRQLPADAARVFRRLALHPCPDLDPTAAAALTGVAPPERFGLVADRLVRAHLVQRTPDGRLALHDLLRAYAGELAADVDGVQGAGDAFDRLCSHQIASAAAAMDRLHPGEASRRPRVPVPADRAAALADPDAALAWLEAETDGLLTLAGAAPARDRPLAAVQLAAILARHLERTGRLPEGAILHEGACAAAGDPAGRAGALVNLGNIRWLSGNYARAAEAFRAAGTLARASGDLVVEARANANLGSTYFRWGRYEEAETCHRLAWATAVRSGDRVSQGRALQNLAGLQSATGRHAEAVATCAAALDVFGDIGSDDGVARTLSILAEAHLEAGQPDLAAEQLAEALPLLRRRADVDGEADALDALGSIRRTQGRHEQALTDHEAALAIFRSNGNRCGVARALNGVGATLLAIGNTDRAADAFREALALARDLQSPVDQNRALEGLAACAQLVDAALPVAST
jgi:DNA-binding SARP family transcriptional activator/tetratricopeptide (TPR) repeat protein